MTPASIQPEAIERELFGQVSMSSGSTKDERVGLFQQADGGTIFLDEIGDLPSDAQLKLLRVLERGEYFRVGESTTRRVDVRLITATHCDLDAMVAAGTFRKDLLYRINGAKIQLPPLRERGDDLRLLTEYFLTQMGYPKTIATVDSSLNDELKRRQWPGNVRELRNAVQHAAFTARGRKLCIDDFPNPAFGKEATSNTSTIAALQDAVEMWIKEQLANVKENETDLYDRFLQIAQTPLLEQVLEYTAGNKARAAELLGIHRSTLREKLRHQ